MFTMIWLNYHMKLHYSQTEVEAYRSNKKLNYHMKLHYSQTNEEKSSQRI